MELLQVDRCTWIIVLFFISSLLNGVEAQNPTSVSKFYSEFFNYWDDLADDDDFKSLSQGLATAAPAVKSEVLGLRTATDLNALVVTPSAITELPDSYKSYLLSVYDHEKSLASDYGILSNGQLVGQTIPVAMTVTGAAASATVITSIVTQTPTMNSAAAAAASSQTQASSSAQAVSTGGPPPSSGTPKSTSIGLGVGLGIGLPVVAAVAGVVAMSFLGKKLFFGKRRDRRSQSDGYGVDNEHEPSVGIYRGEKETSSSSSST